MEYIIDSDGKWEDYGSYKILIEPSQEYLDKFKNQSPQEPQPTELELLQQKVEQQDKVIQELMFEIIPSIAGGGM